MAVKNNGIDMLNWLIQNGKAVYKICNSLIECINNSHMSLSKRFDIIEKELAELKKEVQKTDKLLSGELHIYTDEEIYNLKKCLSWNKLHLKTNIPISTLQYRYKRYIRRNGENSND